jgi:hypothetical protein
MICTSLKAFSGGVALATMLLIGSLAQAKGPSLTYHMLLAVDDPVEGPSVPPRPTQPDSETPVGLTGDAPHGPAADVGEVKSKPSVKDEDEDEGSVFRTWWFWALTAGIVGSTVALGVWAGQPGDTPARICQPDSIACFGDGRN